LAEEDAAQVKREYLTGVLQNWSAWPALVKLIGDEFESNSKNTSIQQSISN
jgi:hypothetical protein